MTGFYQVPGKEKIRLPLIDVRRTDLMAKPNVGPKIVLSRMGIIEEGTAVYMDNTLSLFLDKIKTF